MLVQRYVFAAITLNSFSAVALTTGLITCATDAVATEDNNSALSASLPDNQIGLLKSGVAQSRNLLGQTAATIGVGLDSIFGSPDKGQPNESSIILRSGIRFEQGNEPVLLNGFNFRADLPATSSKFQLLIRLDDENRLNTGSGSSNDETKDSASTSGSARNSAAAAQTDQADTKTSTTSLGFSQDDQAGIFFRYLYQPHQSLWQTSLDIGWQLDTSNFDTQAISYLRIGRNYQVGDWVVRPEPMIFWTEDSGPGTGASLHTQKELDLITTLNSTTGVHYLFDDDTIYYQHGWQLVKVFNPDLRATYSVTFYTTDEADNLIDETQIGATLRRRINGNWLFFSVTPADTLKADNNYRSDLSLTLQLEAKFGTQY